MLGKIRRRRELLNQIAAVKQRLTQLNNLNDEYGQRRKEQRDNLFQLQQGLEMFESNLVVSKARRLAIDIPTQDEQPTWWTDNSEEVTVPSHVNRWLSATGRIRVSRFVQEEQRKSIEWWVKIVVPLLAALISLLGLLVALITILRNKPRS